MPALSSIIIASMAEEITEILRLDAQRGRVGRDRNGLYYELRTRGFPVDSYWAESRKYVRDNLQGFNGCIYSWDGHTAMYRAYGDVVGVSASEAKPALESHLRYCATRTQGNVLVVDSLATAFPSNAHDIGASGAKLYLAAAGHALVDGIQSVGAF